jgi:hypothetical protein
LPGIPPVFASPNRANYLEFALRRTDKIAGPVFRLFFYRVLPEKPGFPFMGAFLGEIRDSI